jgi:phage-related baseplate assembly protein
LEINKLPHHKKYPPIKYTSRDFNSIRRDLIEYAKRYYPNTFKDFSEAGFGSLMIDSVSYIGDILSFYMDYSVNESFLETAVEYDNILKLGKQLGYKFPGNPSSFGEVDLYIIIPAGVNGGGPDLDYMPILKKGTTFSSTGGNGFALTEDVNFRNPTNEIVVARVNNTTGAPLSYAVKTSGKVMSGVVESEEFTVGAFEKFLRLELSAPNISEVVSITDAQGNEYYEVDYLSQDVVYRAVANTGANSTVTQANMRPFVVPRRFVVERDRRSTFIQFGFGQEITENNVEPLIDPSKIVLEKHGRDYYSDTNFDPYNLLKTDKLGVAPSNTTLTVTYRTNEATNVNASSNSIVNVGSPIFEFSDESSLNSTEVDTVINSLEVNNENPIVGDVTLPTVQELKNRIYSSFTSQNRAVTQEDYKIMCYSMPPQFGSIKRVSIKRDPSSLKRNLNLYVTSEDGDGRLIQTNNTIKENLKTWLNSSRMINDTIDILDAKIVNIGIEFTAIADLEANKYDVLSAAVEELTSFYSRKFDVGEPFSITEVYSRLNKLDGIIDVSRVKIVHKSGVNYSPQAFNVNESYSDDGRYLIAPDNVIFEIKFPQNDIKGTIK